MTTFISRRLDELDDGDQPTGHARHAFLLKPLTGRTHQLRVALKALGAPVLGDPMYAATADARLEERCYLHAAVMRIPAGSPALSDGAESIEVRCQPSEGSAFCASTMETVWREWFPPDALGETWFDGTPVKSSFVI